MSIQVTITDDGRVEGYLYASEFAEKCKVSPNTIRVWIGRGKISDYIKIGNEYWISKNEPKPVRKVRSKKPKDDYEYFYFVEDAAIALDVDPETVRRWIRSGALKATMTSRRIGYRIMEDDLRAFAMTYTKRIRNIWTSKGL